MVVAEVSCGCFYIFEVFNNSLRVLLDLSSGIRVFLIGYWSMDLVQRSIVQRVVVFGDLVVNFYSQCN